jgi:hypothetical protein
MEPITDIPTYLRAHAQELGDRIPETYPPLHSIDDPPSPVISKLLRKPYPAQTLVVLGLVKRWQQAKAGAVIAECGTGKTSVVTSKPAIGGRVKTGQWEAVRD